MIYISESGMRFGPFDEEEIFQIEKSQLYKRLQDGLKVAEFICLRSVGSKTLLWIVEAKQSSPQPTTQPEFSKFITEVHEKLVNAMNLFLACHLKRHEPPEASYPAKMAALELSRSGSDFRFILIMRGHKDAWLPPLQEELTNVFRPVVKAWSIAPPGVHVLNDSIAAEYGLIKDIQ